MNAFRPLEESLACRLNRRVWLRSCSAGAAGVATSCGWLPAVAAARQAAKSTDHHFVLLWMSGGPSQIDTFDMKPDHANGGSIKPASTNVPGLAFSEHLPQLAKQADSLAILRGMSTKEGDHGRGTTLMRTGHVPGGPVAYPSIGCSLSKELGVATAELPDYVSITPNGLVGGGMAIRPGFLGKKYAPTTVAGTSDPGEAFASLRVDFLRRDSDVSADRHSQRLELWRSMQQRFRSGRPTENVVAHDAVYQSAIRMLNSDAREAFDLDRETDEVRRRYGRGVFGQGCLLARRLIEQGVPVVEVALGDGLGWDTHTDNFTRVEDLCRQLDAGWSSLMNDLRDRGLLQKTTILWAGEFGRTPVINNNGGRDHYPQAFTCVLAGGGIAGGQAYGQTSPDGGEVIDGRMNQQDLLSTLCAAGGIDPATENIAEGGRPIMLAEGNVIDQVLT